MRKTKTDDIKFPQFPDTDQEADDTVKEMGSFDQETDALFKKAEQLVEIGAAKGDLTEAIDLLRILHLTLREERRVMWYACFEMRKARKALDAATESSDNIVDGICNCIIDARSKPVPVKINVTETDTTKLKVIHKQWVDQEKKYLEEIRKRGFYVIPEGSFVVWMFVFCFSTTVSLLAYWICMLFK